MRQVPAPQVQVVRGDVGGCDTDDCVPVVGEKRAAQGNGDIGGDLVLDPYKDGMTSFTLSLPVNDE